MSFEINEDQINKKKCCQHILCNYIFLTVVVLKKGL